MIIGEKILKMKKVKRKARLVWGIMNRKVKLNHSQLVFYTGPIFQNCESYELTDAPQILKNTKFDPLKKTVLYIHGYLEHLECESIQVIVEAYLKRQDHNILVLDWAENASGSYLIEAVPRSQRLATYVAKSLISLFNSGLPPTDFHLVGHSLGAQMAGKIGHKIMQMTDNSITLERITGLDPAFPGFYFTPFSKHINAKNAKFVDIIHTDAFLYGAPISSGTVDFWPNGGKTLQPGCPPRNYKITTDIDLCSHRRSWWFWAESVSNIHDNKFNAVQAKNWKDFKRKNAFVIDESVVMGIDCPVKISGDYYLQTNGATPFARGIQGIFYGKEGK